MSKIYRIGIVGFGTVGQGITEILFKKKNHLNEDYNFNFKVVGISDPVKGMVFNSDGLNIEKALNAARSGKRLEDVGIGDPDWDSLKLIREGELNILLEITPTNLKTGEPGLTHIREALSRGVHVATTNKGPIALAYNELNALANKNNAILRFEGTVLSGTPVFNLRTYGLAGATIKEISGIVNGTTNYILTQMAAGKSYEDALKEAQAKGYAETDPTADVEGHDALAKAVILANVILGGSLHPNDVPCKGITEITTDDVDTAKKEGKKWKLIARTWIDTDGTVKAEVRPQKLDSGNPLYSIDGVTNALTFETDVLGSVTIVGPGAGSWEAGYALLTDMLDIHRILQKQGT